MTLEYFRFWIVDQRTGKLRLSTYKMTREEARERYPGAEPEMATRVLRAKAPATVPSKDPVAKRLKDPVR